MVPIEPIIEHLKRKLREAGSARWELIARECGVAKSLPRKLVYGDRENPGVQTIQPLIDFFEAVAQGHRQLPNPELIGTEGAPAVAVNDEVRDAA